MLISNARPGYANNFSHNYPVSRHFSIFGNCSENAVTVWPDMGVGLIAIGWMKNGVIKSTGLSLVCVTCQIRPKARFLAANPSRSTPLGCSSKRARPMPVFSSVNAVHAEEVLHASDSEIRLVEHVCLVGKPENFRVMYYAACRLHSCGQTEVTLVAVQPSQEHDA